MNESSQFPLTTLGWQRPPGSAEFLALLNALPQAAMLVDIVEQRIVGANELAADLTGFTVSELSTLGLGALFTTSEAVSLTTSEDKPGPATASKKRRRLLDGENLKKLLASQHNNELTRQDGNKVAVWLSPLALTPRSKWYLITLEDSGRVDRRRGLLHNDTFWQNIQYLVDLPQRTDYVTALKQALQIGSGLCQANIMAVYQASEFSPELQLVAARSGSLHLPERLPPQDLMTLATPYLWTPGERTLSSLHRFARTNHLDYLASAPLGQAKACIGLVVAGDVTSSATQHTLPIVQVLAGVLTSTIQQQVGQQELSRVLQQQAFLSQVGSAILEVVEEGILLLSPDLRVVTLNPAAETILKYSNKDVKNLPVGDLIIGAEIVTMALEAAQHGAPTLEITDVSLYRRTGEMFPAHLRILPITQDAQVEGIIILLQDLGEAERQNEQIQQLEQRALMGELNAIFAHEVGNGINSISTGLQLMSLNMPEEDPRQEAILRLQQDCDRLSELMKSALSFARANTYEMERLNLDQMLHHLADRSSGRFAASRVQLTVQVEPNLPYISGNLYALEQIFNNIMKNAVQAMQPGGGSLIIKAFQGKTEQGDGYVEVSIADTGPGIPPEYQGRIFQPFFTTKRDGTGLGLAIARRIITAHHGSIHLDSFPGGTVFHIRFPAAD